jgi:hypothetical protein
MSQLTPVKDGRAHHYEDAAGNVHHIADFDNLLPEDFAPLTAAEVERAAQLPFQPDSDSGMVAMLKERIAALEARIGGEAGDGEDEETEKTADGPLAPTHYLDDGTLVIDCGENTLGHKVWREWDEKKTKPGKQISVRGKNLSPIN